MRDSRPSLILFAVAAILVVIAKIFEFDQLIWVVKPIVVPALYYYYLQTKRKPRISLLFSIAIWLFFVADMIMILYPNKGIIAIMYCCLVSYLILIKFAIDDCKRIKFSAFNIMIIILLLFLLSYIVYSILTLSMGNIVEGFPLFLLYGIVLIALGVIAVTNYLSNGNVAFLYYCLMAICMIISDFFYCIHKYVFEMPLIDHTNLFVQFVSYFFMVKYFNARKSTASK